MKTLFALNLTGLAAVTAIEALRPGFVSGAISLGWIWMVSVVLMAFWWRFGSGSSRSDT